jgi:hypothetical protein
MIDRETFDPEFDSVFEVMEDGTIVECPRIHAPELLDDQLDSLMWEFASEGYTGQYGYNGPIMHNSEFFGGRLREDILSTPGIYALVVSCYFSETDYDEYDVEGWAVVRFTGSE